MFNALKYTKDLEESGFDRNQAETLVEMYMKMLEFNMVSKSEFQEFKSEIRHRFEKVDQKFEMIDKRFEMLEQRFETVDQSLDYKLDKLALILTVKLGVMLAIALGMISSIITFKA